MQSLRTKRDTYYVRTTAQLTKSLSTSFSAFAPQNLSENAWSMMKYGGGMNDLPYPSDLTAAQWSLIERLLPAPKPKGRKRRVDLRKITNAILYVLKGGISWRMLPREFAPWKTVYHYFRLWRLAGLWDRIHDQLRDQVRVSKGRHICPSAAIVDSQSVATQQKGAIGATMLRSAPRVVSGISWSTYWV